MTSDNHYDDEGERRRDSVDLSYGGLNIMARGSIVVLVLLSIVNASATFMTYSWLTTGMTELARGISISVATMQTDLGKMKGEVAADHRSLRDDVFRNRDFLREIGRTCLLTNDQKQKIQLNMSPGLRELLMREYIGPDK